MLIDVRTPAEYAKVHADGAMLMPLGGLDPAAVRSRLRDGSESVFVICHSGSRSAKACETLDKAGIAALAVEGGTQAWEKLGLPVRRLGGKVISLERQVRIGAGSLVLIGAILSLTVHPWFLALAIFVGGGLVFAGITDFCGMGLILARMPWNRRGVKGCEAGKKCAESS
jgi:rhodanese-related sulfurtransferase